VSVLIIWIRTYWISIGVPFLPSIDVEIIVILVYAGIQYGDAGTCAFCLEILPEVIGAGNL